MTNNILINGDVSIPGKKISWIISVIILAFTLVFSLIASYWSSNFYFLCLLDGANLILSFVISCLFLAMFFVSRGDHLLFIGITFLGVFLLGTYRILSTTGVIQSLSDWSSRILLLFFSLNFGFAFLMDIFIRKDRIKNPVAKVVLTIINFLSLVFISIIVSQNQNPQILNSRLQDWILGGVNLIVFIIYCMVRIQRLNLEEIGIIVVLFSSTLGFLGFEPKTANVLDVRPILQFGALICVISTEVISIYGNLVEKRLMRTMIDFMPNLIYIKDRQSRYIINNRSQLLQLGATSQIEVRGKSDKDFFPPELAKVYLKEEQEFLKKRDSLIDHEEVYEDRTTGEKNLWLISTKLPIVNEKGIVVGLIGTGRDNTRLKIAEGNLKSLVEHLKEDSRNYAGEATHLANIANDAANTTKEISRTIQQVALGVNQQASAINQTTGSIEQIAEMINNLAKGGIEQAEAVVIAQTATSEIMDSLQKMIISTRSGAERSQNAADTAINGASIISDTIQAMDKIKTQVIFSEQKVIEMDKRSTEIGTILQTIEDIATQTNLLALNAAIESARAGEHGKGFSIVADEVRKLAERAGSATKEIGELIKMIQRTVGEAMEAMQNSGKEVAFGVGSAQRARRALEDILETIEIVNQQVNDIASSSKQIEGGSTNLKTTMDKVGMVVDRNTTSINKINESTQKIEDAMEKLASVSQENSASVEEISASAQDMFDQVDQIKTSSKGVSEMAETLKELVSQFDPGLLKTKNKRFGESED